MQKKDLYITKMEISKITGHLTWFTNMHTVIGNTMQLTPFPKTAALNRGYEVPELYEVKVSRTVLRRRRVSNHFSLFDNFIYYLFQQRTFSLIHKIP